MTTALEGGEWSAARPGRNLHPGKTRYSLYRRLGGPQSRSVRAKNLAPPGFFFIKKYKTFIHFRRGFVAFIILTRYSRCTNNHVYVCDFLRMHKDLQRSQYYDTHNCTLYTEPNTKDLLHFGTTRSPDRPARSQSLYRLSYPAHIFYIYLLYFNL